MMRRAIPMFKGVPCRSVTLHGRLLLQSRRLYATTSSPAPRSAAFQGAVVSVGFFLAAAGAYYYETSSPTSTSDSTTTSFIPTSKYTVKVRNNEYSFDRKTNEQIETILHEHEDGQVIGRKGNPVFRWDRNWVGSNEPCEDRSAVDIIPRIRGVAGPGSVEGDRDISLFSIMDGHAGDATSKLLAKALHPTLTLSLAGLQADAAGAAGWKVINPLSWFSGKVWNPSTVTETLKKAFVDLDDNICQTPVKLLPTLEKTTSLQTFVALAGPAQAGACAISTVIDAENDVLYVALAGDCRAVAGWQDTDGRWRCDVLSEDQMGENPREIARMQSEHPASERDTVIMRGRVQGGLQPTRAFGDAVYKWTREQADRINAVFSHEGAETRSQRPTHFTPPYVTAEPVVTHRKIHQNGEKLRFVVLATDGLWDRITSEEATLLVASYVAHQSHPDISKQELAQKFPLAPPPADRPYPAQDLPGSPSQSKGGWVFEGDQNAATHLIRNSLAGSDRSERNGLLSMNGKVTRWFRDDITVSVVFFADDAESR